MPGFGTEGRRLARRTLHGLVVVLISTASQQAMGQDFGRFSGPILLELLPDGRNMRVARPITFTSPDKTQWKVPVGAITNGATIPSALWSVVGGPWEGKYRDAAVVHDHYCTTKERPAKEAHRMFYDASRSRGVSKTVADLMYAAILTWDRDCGEPSSLSFGDGESAPIEQPRSPSPGPGRGPSSEAPSPPTQPEVRLLPPGEKNPAEQRKLLRALKKKLEKRNYTPDEIEDLTGNG
jgi:Protein of unknown function (DUF1353)